MKHWTLRIDTPFRRASRAEVDLAGASEWVAFYDEHGPAAIRERPLISPYEQFGVAGYLAMPVGHRVPTRGAYTPSNGEAAR